MRWVPVFLLFAIVGIPVAAGVAGALAAGFERPAWQMLLSTPGLGRSIGLSVWTGAAATVISVTLGQLAVALAWTRGWSGRLRALSLPLLATPHLALAIGWVLV
ncbi:MAG: ABC transporter permease, partial [Steroidobacteraceae bacterium]